MSRLPPPSQAKGPWPRLLWSGIIATPNGARVVTRVVLTDVAAGVPKIKVEVQERDALGSERWDDGRGSAFIDSAKEQALVALADQVSEYQRRES